MSEDLSSLTLLRWCFKYRFDDKEKLLALGTYADVGWKDAREGGTRRASLSRSHSIQCSV